MSLLTMSPGRTQFADNSCNSTSDITAVVLGTIPTLKSVCYTRLSPLFTNTSVEQVRSTTVVNTTLWISMSDTNTVRS